ncbi:MAG: VOC family protein [Planctomycetes bacterium]|nr:VOC family protein [Planctomycetota bacterium]
MPRCDHVVFRVADLERSVPFYERLLPARLVSRVQRADRWRSEIATLEPLGQSDFRIVLIQPHRVSWLLRLFHALVPRQTRSHEHTGFACASREELGLRIELARELGAVVTNPPTQVEGRDAWVCEVLDPDRNALEWTFGRLHD